MIEGEASAPEAMHPEGPDRQGDRAAPSFAELFGDLWGDGVMLLKREIALAKLETTENVRRAGVHIALVIAGALIAFAGGVVLLLCMAALVAWAFLALGATAGAAVAAGLACVGLGAAGGGAALLYCGGRNLRNQSILPAATIENLKRDTQCIKQAAL